MNINATMLGEMITFILLVLFTMKFVWPPISSMLEERASKITDGLAAAEKGKQQLLDAEANIAEELKKIQARAGEIVANAEKRANQVIEESKERARIEGDKIIADAKAQIEQDFVRMKEDLRLRVSDLVIRGTEQILRVEIDQSRHEKILAQLKAEL
ncbi:MAG: F0F1 ATP synthase subunit B [Neisseriales bacterium]|nr:MAG: F0F1 ATP synthase subunit B [Neisseriales bacterium]HRG62876.1 F0F1 ATP synthase subunit B [Burkholderiales bacterium]